jgi:glycosyltransferase involved in cell wall biosynthesis
MIYKSIKNIFSDYDEFKKIAINGRTHVIKNFNWAKINKEYEDVIFKTIKKFRDANV